MHFLLKMVIFHRFMFVCHRGYLFPNHHFLKRIPIEPISLSWFMSRQGFDGEPTGCSLVLVPVGVPSKGRSKRHEKFENRENAGRTLLGSNLCLKGGFPKMVGFPQLAHGFSY